MTMICFIAKYRGKTYSVFILLIILCSGPPTLTERGPDESSDSVCYSNLCLHQEQISWAAAEKHCAGQNGTLLGSYITTEPNNVKQLMKKATPRFPIFLWIGVKYHLSNWTWTDGKPEYELDSDSKKYCGMYNNWENKVEPEYCDVETGKEFICQGIKDAVLFENGSPVDLSNPVHFEDNRFVKSTVSTQSWMQAHNFCQSYGMNLAHVHKELLYKVKERLNLQKQSFWVGVTRWKWQWAKTGEPAKRDISGLGSVDDPHGCVGIYRASNDSEIYTWNYNDCSENATGFICQRPTKYKENVDPVVKKPIIKDSTRKYANSTEVTNAARETSSQNNAFGTVGWLYILTSICIMLLVALICLIVWNSRKRHVYKHPQRQSPENRVEGICHGKLNN